MVHESFVGNGSCDFNVVGAGNTFKQSAGKLSSYGLKSNSPICAARAPASLIFSKTSLRAHSAAFAVSTSSVFLCRASLSAFKARRRDTSREAAPPAPEAARAELGGRSLMTPVACQPK